MKIIGDEHINLDEKDDLSTLGYVRALEDIIIAADGMSSACIGLFGEWGSGKSSISDTVKKRLESREDKKVKFVTYDAWKYANDSFRRTFLLQVRDELKIKGYKKLDRFYQNVSEDRYVFFGINWLAFILFIAAVLTVGLLISGFLKNSTAPAEVFLLAAASFLGTFLFKVFPEMKAGIQKPYLFAPEQFEECFRDMVELVMGTPAGKPRQLNASGVKLDQLVIVIDNIDRTSAEQAFELLTTVRTFLNNIPRVSFIIPVDEKALKKHIRKGAAEDNDAEEFLRKIFSVVLRVKPYRAMEMFEYTRKTIGEHRLSFSPTTVDVIAKEYARTPRRIKQFINNFSAELVMLENKFGKDFVTSHEPVICLLSIIREEWSGLYEMIVQHPSLLIKQDNAFHEYIKENVKPATFLSLLRNVYENTPAEVFYKIVHNTVSVDGIGLETQVIIDENRVEELCKLIDQNPQLIDAIQSYMIDSLRKGIQNDLFQTEVRNKLHFLLCLDEKFPAARDFCIRLSQQLEPCLGKAVACLDEPDRLMRFAYRNKEFELRYFVDGTLKYLTDKLVQTKPDLQPSERRLLWAFMKHPESQVPGVLIKGFQDDYNRNAEQLSSFGFPDKALSEILTEPFINTVINRIKDYGDKTDPFLADTAFCASKTQFSEDNIIRFFSQIYNVPPMHIQQPDNNQVISMLELLNPVLESQNFAFSHSFQLTAATALSRRIMDEPFKRFILEEGEGVQQKGIVYLQFLLNIYRVFNPSIETIAVFSRILNKETAYKEHFYKLVQKMVRRYPNTNLSDLRSFFISEMAFSEAYMDFLAAAFESKAGSVYVMSDEECVLRLQRFIESGATCESINKFLQQTGANSRGLELLLSSRIQENKSIMEKAGEFIKIIIEESYNKNKIISATS